ncbi:unnamed protein product [Ambrosiozyma monospora]|uniref:Unnamed protein product n=1 Tax=Ambrosiozyma monospora TaxID=43982 RepID=A0A9W6Z0K7_AMBMO|nr:unnamed protein product [Ambrosiozyma monospora]
MSVDSFSQDLEKGPSSSTTASGPNKSKSLPYQDAGAVHKVKSSFRADDDNIYINDEPINKEEFMHAFGGTLTVGARKQTEQSKNYGDPVPAGLAAFSCTTFTLGLIEMHAKGVTHANSLLGALLTTSGIVLLITGILCFIVGNTWASATFLMFGGFWSSYAFILMNVGGQIEAYSSTEEFL